MAKIHGEYLGKSKMLFVDDRWKRIEFALNNYSQGFDVTIAPCVPEALRYMVKEDYAVISLDHDLNGHDFQDPDTPTCGMEIVRYIVKCGGWPKPIVPEFWIHSSNLFAAHLMCIELAKVDIFAAHRPIIYKVENMQYDVHGVPV